MAGEIKPGSCLWVKTHIGRVDPGEWIETDTDSGKGFYRKDWDEYLIRDHPALPAVAALLQSEPGLAAAIARILSVTEIAWQDEESWVAKDVLKRFAAALEGQANANGNVS